MDRKKFHGATLLLLFAGMAVFGQQGQYREYLVGGSAGLYRLRLDGNGAEVSSLWTGGSVRMIVPAGDRWYFVTSAGLRASRDLEVFEDIHAGLPLKTLLAESGADTGGNPLFTPRRMAARIKSLAVDPENPSRLAAVCDEAVWYSEDSGQNWTSLGSPSAVAGLNQVSFGPAPTPDSTVAGSAGKGTAAFPAAGDGMVGRSPKRLPALWVSHAIKGVFATPVDPPSCNGWILASAGLPKVFGSNGEEVSGFALVAGRDKAAEPWTLLAGMSFQKSLYRWNPSAKSFVESYRSGDGFGSVDSLLSAGQKSAMAIVDGELKRFMLDSRGAVLASYTDIPLANDLVRAVRELRHATGDSAECAALVTGAGTAEDLTGPASRAFLPALHELWAFDPAGIESRLSPAALERRTKADGRDGIYLQTGFVIDPATRKKYFDLCQALGLGSIVVDLKDDAGKLRFAPKSELLRRMGSTGNRLDLEAFSAEAKARGLYLIARIVVFKDEALSTWQGGALAVRDGANGGAWRGLRKDGQPYGEFWVDPYSPEVWRYNVEIAKEVTTRGFDEVQFDYIRFPTDGENLAMARYPAWQEGMTQDSALESFLRYARSKLDVPVSIDIYGANGWYRSGTRTGQDVEMLADHVDVISPMFYPSHFEQEFLAQAPARERPYRIYRLGTLRAARIARGKALIRPYVQAFYLDVSYDRLYYDKDYVLREVRGVRDGANQGMTFWNNSGRYTDLPVLR
jgi:hypothetical protein